MCQCVSVRFGHRRLHAPLQNIGDCKRTTHEPRNYIIYSKNDNLLTSIRTAIVLIL